MENAIHVRMVFDQLMRPMRTVGENFVQKDVKISMYV